MASVGLVFLRCGRGTSSPSQLSTSLGCLGREVGDPHPLSVPASTPSRGGVPEAPESPCPARYLLHEELDSQTGHAVATPGGHALLDDVPLLVRGLILLLAQIL